MFKLSPSSTAFPYLVSPLRLASLRRGFFCGRALCNQPASRPVELAG